MTHPKRNLLFTLMTLAAMGGVAQSAERPQQPQQPSALRYRVIELSIPDGATMLRPRALNDLGQAVGEWLHEEPGTKARHFSFLWSHGVLKDLGPLAAQDINNRGQVVGRWEAEAERPGAKWAFPAALWQEGKLSFLDVFSLTRQNSTGYSINDRGQIAGIAYQEKPYALRELLWEGGKTRELARIGERGKWRRDFPEHHASDWSMSQGPHVLNNRGQVAGYVLTAAKDPFGYPIMHAALWRDGLVTDLGTLPGFPHSSATALNDHGHAAGVVRPAIPPYPHSREHFVRRAVLWERGKARDLGLLPGGDMSEAHAINNRGQVVGSAASGARSGSGNPLEHAVLWQQGRLIDLNDVLPSGSKVVLLQAVDINERGQILCEGLENWDGRRRAYLLSPQE